ncbi:acetyl-CoA carboxylase biotin carboxyl carrier protein, partial [Olsenella sp. SW781]|uniref:acetyl-CoA carboxylase biotin carboxyl carrier protein n=1 Tax=Olsenella sp. SW781 TaxID=2530046 RepID=UPI00143C0292
HRDPGRSRTSAATDVYKSPPMDMSHATAVRAPMVGVFYAAPSPGAEPFVHVGSKVKKGETLCVIEAMKVMNEVTAEADGEIVDICVKDGDLVEYGCCLMKIY